MIPRVSVPKTYRVEEISSRHHEIARLLLLGMQNKEIALTMGISDGFVSNVKNSPVVREQLDLMAAERDRDAIDVAKQINETLPKCVEFLARTIEDDDVSKSLRSRNAFGLLSAGGHGPSKNVSVKGVHAVLTADDISEIRTRGLTLASEIGIMADVPVSKANKPLHSKSPTEDSR